MSRDKRKDVEFGAVSEAPNEPESVLEELAEQVDSYDEYAAMEVEDEDTPEEPAEPIKEPDEAPTPEPLPTPPPLTYRATENFKIQGDTLLTFKLGDLIESFMVPRLLAAKAPITSDDVEFVKCTNCGHHNAIQ